VREGRGRVVGVGPSPDGRFVYAAEGAFGDVAAALADAGVESAIAFGAREPAGPGVVVRGENGWISGSGEAPAERDVAGARLTFEAVVNAPVALRLGKTAAPLGAR
jgi:hypothetical protein